MGVRRTYTTSRLLDACGDGVGGATVRRYHIHGTLSLFNTGISDATGLVETIGFTANGTVTVRYELPANPLVKRDTTFVVPLP